MAMKASSMPANLALSWAAIACPDNSGDLRASNGSRTAKTMPALELLVKPLMDSPGNATAFSTPGCASTTSPIRRMTSSVRSRVAPSGSCAKPIRYCLSCAGTKPPGTALNTTTVSPTSTR
jgi:hypothetical protein